MFIALFKHCYCIVVASRPGRLEVEANSYRRIGEPTEAPTETEERVKFSCHDCHDSTRRPLVHLCAIWQRTWKNYGIWLIWLILTLWWRNVIDIEAYSITRSPSLPCRNQKLQDLQVLVGSSVGPSWETGLPRPGASTHWPQWPQWP